MKNLMGTGLTVIFLFFMGCDDEETTICCNGSNDLKDSEVLISNNINGTREFVSDSIYILTTRIVVEDGATLSIEAGTIIKGRAGSGENASVLIIARGAKLNVNGTSDAPVIFTSEADKIEPGSIASPNLTSDIAGLWGGVIILGKAPGSFKNDALEIPIEGIPTTDTNGMYGGSQATDNSGTINYISIRHGGTNIGEGNEINGLTLGSVGSGTSIKGVEVVGNADDGIEWFGGTVNVSNVMIWNSNDDAMDTDQDWVGTCSDFIIVSPNGGSAFELDGPEGTEKVNDDIRTYHLFENGTLYTGTSIDHIIDWDENTNAAIKDLYIFGISDDYAIIPDGNDDNTDPDFEPIESFEGDKSGKSSGWEVTLSISNRSLEEIFGTDAPAIIEEVTLGSKTKGPSTTDFEWTWASKSATLTDIGL